MNGEVLRAFVHKLISQSVCLELCNPRIEASLCLVVFVHLVERTTYELTRYHGRRVIERIAVGRHRTDETASSRLKFLINSAQRVAERIAERRRIAASEQTYELPAQVCFLQGLKEIIPIILQIA